MSLASCDEVGLICGVGSPLECIILIGLPGAGKSSLHREKFARTHLHVSKDLWPNATKREDRQREMIKDALASGKSAVADNTNPTIAERAALIRIARAHGARVVGYFFDVNTRTAVARNAERTGRGKVPNVAIFTAAKRLQRPSLAEGFDQLFRVTIDKNRKFEIAELSA
jgi:predicted kinase